MDFLNYGPKNTSAPVLSSNSSNTNRYGDTVWMNPTLGQSPGPPTPTMFQTPSTTTMTQGNFHLENSRPTHQGMLSSSVSPNNSFFGRNHVHDKLRCKLLERQGTPMASSKYSTPLPCTSATKTIEPHHWMAPSLEASPSLPGGKLSRTSQSSPTLTNLNRNFSCSPMMPYRPLPTLDQSYSYSGYPERTNSFTTATTIVPTVKFKQETIQTPSCSMDYTNQYSNLHPHHDRPHHKGYFNNSPNYSQTNTTVCSSNQSNTKTNLDITLPSFNTVRHRLPPVNDMTWAYCPGDFRPTVLTRAPSPIHNNIPQGIFLRPEVSSPQTAHLNSNSNGKVNRHPSNTYVRIDQEGQKTSPKSMSNHPIHALSSFSSKINTAFNRVEDTNGFLNSQLFNHPRPPHSVAPEVSVTRRISTMSSPLINSTTWSPSNNLLNQFDQHYSRVPALPTSGLSNYFGSGGFRSPIRNFTTSLPPPQPSPIPSYGVDESHHVTASNTDSIKTPTDIASYFPVDGLSEFQLDNDLCFSSGILSAESMRLTEEANRVERLRTDSKIDEPPCSCNVTPSPIKPKFTNYSKKERPSSPPYYPQLGTAPTLPEIRELMEKRTGLKGDAIRIEKLRYTKKEGKSVQGCPIAKWIIRRSGPEEKYLVLTRHRDGHSCATAWLIVVIVAWEGVQSDNADDLYSTLIDKLTKFGLQTERRCGLNERRTCACQGLDSQKAGASFSFGCSWSIYYNGCKFARSKVVRKFRLTEQSEEALIEEKLQSLATNLAPVYKKTAPDAYNNQTEFEMDGLECRLGRNPGRPWTGVTACVDFCAHAHHDIHNMNNGCTVVVTLTKHRGFDKPDDEQLHVLPLYVVDESDEFGSKEAQKAKKENGSIQGLTKYPMQLRFRAVALQSCRMRKLNKKNKDSTPIGDDELDEWEDEELMFSSDFGNAKNGVNYLNNNGNMKYPSDTCKRKLFQDDVGASMTNITKTEFSMNRVGKPNGLSALSEAVSFKCEQNPTNNCAFQNEIPMVRHPTSSLQESKPSFYQPPMTVNPYDNSASHASWSQASINQSSHRPPSYFTQTSNITTNDFPFGRPLQNRHENVKQENGLCSPLPSFASTYKSSFPSQQMNGYSSNFLSSPSFNSFPNAHVPLTVPIPQTLPNFSNHIWNKETSPSFLLPQQQRGTLADFVSDMLHQMSSPPPPMPPPPPPPPPPPSSLLSQPTKTPQTPLAPPQPQFSINAIPGFENYVQECDKLPDGVKMIHHNGEVFYEFNTDNEESFRDNEIGGVAIALAHASVLFECAKHELHATTALKNPNREHPSRISLVFYQHKRMNCRQHGTGEYERKLEKKRTEEAAAAAAGLQAPLNNDKKKKKQGKPGRPKLRRPRQLQIPQYPNEHQDGQHHDIVVQNPFTVAGDGPTTPSTINRSPFYDDRTSSTCTIPSQTQTPTPIMRHPENHYPISWLNMAPFNPTPPLIATGPYQK